MNKKIKVIDLLNKIANGEEPPEKIIYKNEILKYDKDIKEYKGFSRTGSGAFFGALFTNYATDKFINNEIEILENNTEDIKESEEIEELRLEEQYNLNSLDIALENKINELVKVINNLRKGKRG